MKTRTTVLSLFISICGLSATVQAQQAVTSATISGRVEDANGAAVAGAAIAAINLDQNRSSTAQSDSQGRFRFLYLPVGRYRLKIEAKGFSTIERELTLTVGQALDAQLRLSVAGVAERLDIKPEATLIETLRTQVAETVLPTEVDRLPLNGRNYLDLAALTPAVTRANPVANQRFGEALIGDRIGARHGGRERGQVEVVAPVERQAVDLGRQHGLRHLRAQGLNQGRFRFDVESLSHSGHAQPELRVERLADGQRQLAFYRRESFGLNLQPVATDRQIEKAKTALRVALRGRTPILIEIDSGDSRARDRRAVRVFNAPADRGGCHGLLRLNRRAQAADRNEQRKNSRTGFHLASSSS